MTTLDPTTLDDGSSGARSHPGTKPVLALTAANIWLIGAFHNKEVQIGDVRRALGYEAW